jgi:hypothetical protein
MTDVLDRRITSATGNLSVVDLALIWRDHMPATLPTPEHCPGCGHSYLTGPLCPTAALVRPLLRTRRHTAAETVLQLLTYQQFRDLIDKRPSTDRAFRTQRRTLPVVLVDTDQPDLFGGTR